MKNKLYILPILATFLISPCFAEDLSRNTAHMQAMDKITGRVSVINVPVNGEVTFGSLSIVVRSCKTRPVEETPDNFAFVDIADSDKDGKQTNVFKGWMISSSPATHALEHPIYDVWLLQCIDKDIKNESLLSEEQLNERDLLPMQNESKSAKLSDHTLQKKVVEPIEEMEDQSESIAIETNESTDMNATEFFYDEEDVGEELETPDINDQSSEQPETQVEETLTQNP